MNEESSINEENSASTFYNGLKYFSISSGGFSFILGTIVLVGWYTHNAYLIQINKSFVPMQYNAALGFLLSGGALLALNLERNKIAGILGAIILFIGGITLLEYVTGFNLYLDQLFMDHYITVKTSHPGRMAPNTALCFTLTGFAVAYYSTRIKTPSSSPVMGILGALVFGLSVVAFSGYFLDLESAYAWGSLTNMAIHTSAGFIIIGLGLIAIAWSTEHTDSIHIFLVKSSQVGIAGLTITFTLYRALHFHESKIISRLGPEGGNIADEGVLLFGILFSLALSVLVYLNQLMRKSLKEQKEAEETLRKLSRKLESIREEERTEIARDIHDDLGQSLTALKLDISSIKKNTKDKDLIRKTESMSTLVDSTIKAVQKVAARLRPGILDDLGLISAMEWQLAEFQNRSGIGCDFNYDEIDLIIDGERSTTLFRIFQELLTNIARHAKASKVNVQLGIKDDILTLKVNDNGIGISEEDKKESKSYGIMGISERLIPWNGNFEITGNKEDGTKAEVSLPLTNESNK